MALQVTDSMINQDQAYPGFERYDSLDLNAIEGGMTSENAQTLLNTALLFGDCPAPSLHLNAFCEYLAESMRAPTDKSDRDVLSGLRAESDTENCRGRMKLRSDDNDHPHTPSDNTISGARTNDSRGSSPSTARFSSRLSLYTATNSLEFAPGQDAILTAADFGDTQTLQALATSVSALAARDREGLTAVMLAARSGVVNTLRALYEMGADFTARTPVLKDTAMHIAAEAGSPAVLHFLHATALLQDLTALNDQGLPVDVTNILGETPLQLACANDRADNVKALLALGADPTHRSRQGYQAVHVAAATGSISALGAVLEAWQVKPTDIAKHLNTPLPSGKTALHMATEHGHAEIVAALLAYGADPNQTDNEGKTAAFMAAHAGEHDILHVLAAFGADLSRPQSTSPGWTPAHAAASQGHTETLRALSELGAELDQTDQTGKTPAHAAANGTDHRQSATTLAVLHELGVPLNTQDATGESPLHAAAARNNLPAIRTLLAREVDCTARTHEGFTPLDYAIRADNPEAVEQLCRLGAALNTQLPQGASTAHLAAAVGNRDIVSTLQQHHIKLDLQSTNGMRPADIARRFERPLMGYWIQQLAQSNTEAAGNEPDISYPPTAPMHQAATRSTADAPQLRDRIRVELDDWINKAYDTRQQVSDQTYINNAELGKRLNTYIAGENVEVDPEQHPALTAANIGDTAALKWLTRTQAALTTPDKETPRDKDGLTAPMLAVRSGVLSTVRVLSEVGANFDAKTDEPDDRLKREDTIMHIAAMEGSPEIIAFLHAQGAAVNAANTLGASPLHLACAKDRAENVQALLAAGADPLQKTEHGAQAIHLIADAGATHALEVLIKHWTLNNADITNLINKPIPSSGETALHIAIEKGHADLADALLAHGADPNCTDNDRETPAFMAAQRGEADALSALAKHGADLSVGRSTLRQETPVHAAAYDGHTETLRMLAKLGAPMNKTDIGGRNAAHYAACGDPFNANTTLKVLDALGVNLDTQDEEGLTPLHLAVAIENLPAIRTLVRFGANIAGRSTDGYTPLDYAALYNRPKAAELLCRLGANVNTRLPRNASTAHVAAAAGSTDVIKTLQRHKLSLAHKNADGLTPADAAERCQRPLTSLWMREMSRSPA